MGKKKRLTKKQRIIIDEKIQFNKNLNQLGFSKYNDYLKSDLWIDFRTKYYEAHSKKCFVCGCSKHITLHHITYKNLGHEQFNDVTPLCLEHHKLVHSLVNKNDIDLKKVHKQLKNEYAKIVKKPVILEAKSVRLNCPNPNKYKKQVEKLAYNLGITLFVSEFNSFGGIIPYWLFKDSFNKKILDYYPSSGTVRNKNMTDKVTDPVAAFIIAKNIYETGNY